MERADLLYSGLMFTAIVLSLWTAGLVTAACCYFASSVLGAKLQPLNNRPRWLMARPARDSQMLTIAPGLQARTAVPTSAPGAATISSTKDHVSQTPAPPHSLP
ncbi:MAG: hypothetical protein WBS24_18140 [Terriglobales bacterium]